MADAGTSSTPAAATSADPVLRATYDSILEVGLRRTTIAEIARRAGVSRMTIYRKYDDLDRIVSDLLSCEFRAVFEEAESQVRQLNSVRTQLAAHVTQTAALLSKHEVFTRMLAVDPEAILPLIVDRLGSTQQFALEMMSIRIEEGQAPGGDGSIRAGDTDAMALTVLVLAQSMIFSSRALATADPLGSRYTEAFTMIDRYLAEGAA